MQKIRNKNLNNCAELRNILKQISLMMIRKVKFDP